MYKIDLSAGHDNNSKNIAIAQGHQHDMDHMTGNNENTVQIFVFQVENSQIN